MTNQPQYLRYLEEAKLAEVAEGLRSEGYTVEVAKRTGDVEFDLFAQKDGRSRIYEFKSAGSKRLKREELMKLQKAAREAGYEFHIVIVNPPPRVKVEIDSLQSELLAYAMSNVINELDSLSTHTSIDRIDDLEVSEVRVSEIGIKVKGTGTISVTLQYGGSSDGGPLLSDAYPLYFEAMLGPDQKLTSISRFDVDTSSFTE